MIAPDNDPSAARGLKPDVSPKRMRVLISAYACEPNKGSEPGCGWNYVLQISRYCNVHVLTRQNNRSVIEDYEEKNGKTGIRWIYYDLPDWVLVIKKRFGLVNLYYLLWQWFSVQYIRRSQPDAWYDLLHHLTFGSYSKPTFLFLYKKIPFVWGPIGGVVNPAWSFLHHASIRAVVEEMLRMAGQFSVRINPLFQWILRRADLVLGVSAQVFKYVRGINGKILSQVGIDLAEAKKYSRNARSYNRPYTILMAGRFVHWKGFSVGLSAFSQYVKESEREARLILVGEGPECSRLRRLASSLGISDRVDFKGHVDRETFFRIVSESDVLLFPSSHEPGSYVVAESLALGVPVICTTFGEPATLIEDGVSGFAVAPDSYDLLAGGIAERLKKLETPALLERMSVAAVQRASALSWDMRGKELYRNYCRLLKIPGGV